MTKKNIFLIFILLTTISCAANQGGTKGSYIRWSKIESTSTNHESNMKEVEIFYKKSPGYKFVEIGIVEAIAQGKDASLEKLIPELRKQAAKIGSDAVYKIELQRSNQMGDALHATGIALKKQ